MTILSNKKPQQSGAQQVSSVSSNSILSNTNAISNNLDSNSAITQQNTNLNGSENLDNSTTDKSSLTTDNVKTNVTGSQSDLTDKVMKNNLINLSVDDSKTVNIQINDIQSANETVNMPLSSSSSSSSPSSLSSLQTETGCMNSILTKNNKHKKIHFKNKTKSNKKRKLSSTSSVHIGLQNCASITSSSSSTANIACIQISDNTDTCILKESKIISTSSCSSKTTNNQRATSTNTNFETQVGTNAILKLSTSSDQVQIKRGKNENDNSGTENNNDSDSDFEFLNKTDNQISEDDEDSDLNTQFKQNLIHQQIRQQQQLYIHQQQKQLKNNENLNVPNQYLTNATQMQNTRKKLTKKKGSNKIKINPLGRNNSIGIKENITLNNNQKENEYENNINSEDEYENRPLNRNLSGLVNNCFNNKSSSLKNVLMNVDTIEELESKFCQLMKEKKGFIIKPMKEDGACLFRAVSDQIYGDEEMHSTIRSHCMDYIAKNADYFKQYMTEDVDRYLSRKRQDTCHGNHIEIIAIAEIYNRPIEVYEYSVEPKNTFQSVFETDNEPIRLSYHGRNHYNSVVNPYKATIGVGLGLPQLTPGLAEKNLMSEALKKSEEIHLEKTMLDDKKKATDWEATNEEIMELVARESYLQWLKDNEKRNTGRHSLNLNQQNQLPGNATCSTWDQAPSVSHTNTSLTSTDIRLSPPRHQRNTLNRSNIGNRRTSTVTPPHSPSQSKKSLLKTSPKLKNEPHSSKKISEKVTSPTNMLNLTSMTSNSENANQSIYDENIALQAQSQYHYYEPMNELPPELFGLENNDWIGLDNQGDGDGDSDILARVLAASQQEYLESLKAKRNNQLS